jgi:hypothetical protein
VTGAEDRIETITLVEAFSRYLDYCRFSGVRTWNKNRQQHCNKLLAEWAGKTLEEIRHRDIVNFLIARRAIGNGPSTARRYYATIRHFFNWCVDNDHLDRSPVRRGRIRLEAEATTGRGGSHQVERRGFVRRRIRSSTTSSRSRSTPGCVRCPAI